MKGEGKSTAAYFRKGIKYLEESQTVVLLGLAWAWLGYAHCLIGQPKTAVEFTEKGLKMHMDLGLPIGDPFATFLTATPSSSWAIWEGHEQCRVGLGMLAGEQ